MTTTLITGANKSLGFETARRLAEAGHTIYLGSRDEQRGKEAAGRIGARPVQIDVTSDDSVQAAAALIRDEAGHLDVLVNNAGISGGLGRSPGDVTAADMRAVYETNVFGVVRVTHAFLPLLAASSVKKALDYTWSDPADKAEAVSVLVSQLTSLEAWIRDRLPHELARPPLQEHVETLHQVMTQDLEPDPTRGGDRQM